jgi:hypothetical protein
VSRSGLFDQPSVWLREVASLLWSACSRWRTQGDRVPALVENCDVRSRTISGKPEDYAVLTLGFFNSHPGICPKGVFAPAMRRKTACRKPHAASLDAIEN